MPDVTAQKVDEAVRAFLERMFPNSNQMILGRAYLDLRRLNLHDSKGEFQDELKLVAKSGNDLFNLYKSMLAQGDVSVANARRMPLEFMLKAVERNKAAGTPKDALNLAMQNARGVDYWRFSMLFVFDLYLSFSARLIELEEQKTLFWSSQGRPPDHYARTMALRFAKLFAKQLKRAPTVGTSSDGDHPSTEYGRGLQELFEILEIDTGFRLPGEWAVAQIKYGDVQKPFAFSLSKPGLMPNLLNWQRNKSQE
ncbi:hypothetical protein PEL8287_03313 [Roseovarius litorisediminis]|uniref:Uncharacterized protein n=1 Tax=Roseovarius litorisediminis TaxID=1312363 RepID=A0A1Y5TCX6_9RHOB|nr:hypothetical protein [Roseovarius litorisediminis]SLN61271.1 hypothetical protein PEL8287_03313 [Roseovarius litorisediminis]